MATDKDEVLLQIDKEVAISDVFKLYGADDLQANAAAKLYGRDPRVTWNGVRLSFDKSDLPMQTDPAFKAIAETEAKFLLPLPKPAVDDNTDKPIEIDPLRLRSAFIDRNMTEVSRITREIGPDKVLELSKQYGLHSIHDTRKGVEPVVGDEKKKAAGSPNPWSAETWDPLKQQSICRSLPLDKAKAIAASANPPSFVGANRPGQRRLIPA